MTVSQVKVGIIGCGNISGVYLKNCPAFGLPVVAVADIDLARARARATEYEVPRACRPEELLADPAIDLVINLTIPAAHGTVALAALQAGKSVYNEKPLAITREEAQQMLDLADARGLLVGCAPDTFLGAGLQTCRRLIDEGAIGEPVAATAFMAGRGPESWHPDPEFFYKVGGGPLFDLGPYYITALVSLLGPVARVAGSARISFAERLITSKPKYGTRIAVETPTHIAGVLDFATGPIATMIMSFDVWAAELPRIEIYGSEGTLSVPDPNTFGGPVRLFRPGARAWEEVPLIAGHSDNSRGLGVADMARALREGGSYRASGRLAYHVLDVMHALLETAAEGRRLDIASTVERPEPLIEH
jgi:predicted dehydrogenase